MYSFGSVLCILFTFHYSTSTQHYPCQNQPEFINATIEGCNELPCQLKIGTSVEFLVKMEINDYISSLKTEVSAHAMGTDVTYPLPNSDVCTGLVDGECPLDKGEEVTYRLLFPILESFPAVPATVTFIIKSDKITVGCMKLSVLVVNG